MLLGEFWRRLLFLVHRKRRLEEIEEEMRLHADLRTGELQATGGVPQSAAAEAARQFGNRTFLKEAIWDVWSFVRLENAWRDLKFAARLLRKDLTLAVLALALGIGSTTAMFSVIDNVLLEPFPYPPAAASGLARHSRFLLSRSATEDLLFAAVWERDGGVWCGSCLPRAPCSPFRGGGGLRLCLGRSSGVDRCASS